jgi:anti-sigma regulatory factor (Ser/Thr protein kinase)
MDLLGVVIIYKILEYSYKKRCFTSPTLTKNDTLIDNVKRFGFGDLIAECFKDTEKAYRNLKTETIEGFLVAPMALSNNAQEAEKLANSTMQKIEHYLENERIPNASDACIMVSVVLSELFGNFYAHANDMTNSIIVVRGNNKSVQITCADSGLGITETLRTVDKYSTKNEDYILKQALKKGVTSKPQTNHMGHGLWLIDDIVSQNNGILYIYTQSINYINAYNKKKLRPVPKWKGTIIDIVLNIENPCY